MDIWQVREIAKKMGIEVTAMKKTELIRAIQMAEGNIYCYATQRSKTCGEEGCIWRDDCLKAGNKITQIETTLQASSLIIRDLRNSACILSLIVENSAKIIKDERFLKDSFEAINDEVERVKKLISLVKSIIDQNKMD